jgi:uncharacterized membrane protein
LLLFAVVLARFCFYDLWRQFYGGASAAELTTSAYLRTLLERLVAFGIPIASFAIAYRMLAAPPAAAAAAGERLVERSNDVRSWLPNSLALRTLLFAGVAMAFLYLHLELNRTAGHFFAPARLPILTVLWIALCALLMAEYLRSRHPVALVMAALACVAVLGKLFFIDLPSWGMSPRLLYSQPYSFLDALMRLIDFAAIVGFFGGAYAVFQRRETAEDLRSMLGFTCLAMLFIYLTLEVNSYLHQYHEGLQAGGVSILWALFALVLIVRGIARNVAVVRYLGLGLFAIVAGKVFFNDLASLDQFWRIIAFVILGILLIAGSFVYLKYRDKFTLSGEAAPSDLAGSEVKP